MCELMHRKAASLDYRPPSRMLVTTASVRPFLRLHQCFSRDAARGRGQGLGSCLRNQGSLCCTKGGRPNVSFLNDGGGARPKGRIPAMKLITAIIKPFKVDE